ncbi:hypothetical protein M433DRAFT_140590 [Acidomyces richmondensis BFW]|nr:hypothetical protein M433DRAFT_140590 [Acidomyces richmondensis BFW]
MAHCNNGPATGGDSALQNLNQVCYQTGDIAWILTSTVLVLLMIQGVGLFYCSLAQRKSALSLIWLSIVATAITSVTWFFWGPLVAISSIPDLIYAVYQGMFASITVAIADGAVAERGRLIPCLFSCGAPIHVSSGCTVLTYSYVLGKRPDHRTQLLDYRTHNVNHIVIGTVFLWAGWFGFNAVSALGASLRAIMAAVSTNLAAYYRLERKFSIVGFCSGIVVGSFAITPGSGYVPASSAVIFGVSDGVGCNFATQLKYWMQADDTLDIFAVHAIGGAIGNFSDYVAHLDGYTRIKGGWVNHHWIQLAYQICESVFGGIYSFCLTIAILLASYCMSNFC